MSDYKNQANANWLAGLTSQPEPTAKPKTRRVSGTMSRERVRQVEDVALRKLRAQLRTVGVHKPDDLI